MHEKEVCRPATRSAKTVASDHQAGQSATKLGAPYRVDELAVRKRLKCQRHSVATEGGGIQAAAQTKRPS